MRGGLRHKPEARVTILLTNPGDFSKKELVRFTGFQQVTSSLSMNGTGTATVAFPNKDLTFFKGIQRPAWMMTAENEVDRLREAWRKFGDESTSPNIRIPEMYADHYTKKVLLPRVNPFDYIWIDYRGRDGLWYAGFTGIVTGYKETQRPDQTPVFIVNAKDFRRILQAIPIVTGLNNFASISELNTILTEDQTAEAAVENKMATYTNPAAILDEVMRVVNGVLSLEGEGIKKFWAKKVFHDEFTPYTYSADEFDVWTARQDDNPKEKAFYDKDNLDVPVSPHAFNDAQFEKVQPSVYKFLIRSQLNMLAIDTESALSIINKMMQVTLSDFYVDQEGSLRYEYPRYATVPSLSPLPGYLGEKNGLVDWETPFNSLNYWISSKDQAFLGYQGGEDESEVVATRVIATQKYGILVKQMPEMANILQYNGYATAEAVDLVRYGVREVNLPTFYMREQVGKEVMTAYAQAAMFHLNSRSRSFNIKLDQRPDTMLNRCMVFTDRGRVGLITDISDTFSPTGGHQRTHTCRYVRYLGEAIEYPWAEILGKPLEDKKGELQIRDIA